MKKNPMLPPKDDEEKKVHPWRLCPVGSHWVREHSMRVLPSKTNPKGHVTTRHAHCARNPSGKDILFPDEINKISEQNFKNTEPKPCPITLNFGENGSKYDDLIAGWTKYWNDVLSPDKPLDPNLVKALIASESRFHPKILADPKKPKSGRGLMQMIDASRKILGDEKGELKNHFVSASREKLNDPNTNICAGIRWLFYKKKFAFHRLKREASWEEAVYEFKGCRTVPKNRADELMDRFNEFGVSCRSPRKGILDSTYAILSNIT